MTDVVLDQAERPRRLHLEWVFPILFKPRSAFTKIVGQGASVWLTPILLLTLTALARIVVAGSIKQAAALSGGLALPPDFEFYPPAMQAQYMQAMQATSSPVFLYIFPAITALAGVWMGWLLVSGMLHLILTLLGGRGDTGLTLNVVAWAGLPFAVRDIVQTVFMMLTRQLISTPGLSGFISLESTGGLAFLAQLLRYVDLYLIWHVILLVIGVRAGTSLSMPKAVGSTLFTVLLVIALQALLGFLSLQLSSLTVIRPFF